MSNVKHRTGTVTVAIALSAALVVACGSATNTANAAVPQLANSRRSVVGHSAMYPGVPGKPRNVRWTKNVGGRMTVTWQAPTDTGGSAITRYDIYPSDPNTGGFDPRSSKHVNGHTFKVVFAHLDKYTTWTFSVAATNSSSQGLPSRLQVSDRGYQASAGRNLLILWLEVLIDPGQWGYDHGYGELYANKPKNGAMTIYWNGDTPPLIKELVDSVPKDGPIYYARSRFSWAETLSAMGKIPLPLTFKTPSGVDVYLTSLAPNPISEGVDVAYWPANEPDTYQGPFPAASDVAWIVHSFTGNVDVHASPGAPVVLVSR